MKKKVLFLLHTPPPVHGSSLVGSYIQKSTIISETFQTTYINIGTSLSIADIGKTHISKGAIFLKLLYSLIKTLNTIKPDLVYIAITSKGIGFYKDLFFVLISKLLGHKIVFHFHNKGVSFNQNKIIDNFLYSLAFSNTNAIILSQRLYYDIKKYFNKEAVYICPNGIPESKIETTGPLSSTKKQTHFLYLSNLYKSKGVCILLNALKLLKNQSKDFRCSIVGGEGDVSTQELNSLIKEMDLEKEVVYLGKRYGEEKTQIFKSADVFVFPTYYEYEIFSLVNIEAMMYGLPVISTREGAIEDIVVDGETGYLVKRKDHNNLAKKMKLFINTPEQIGKMGKKAQERFFQKFTLSTFENNLLNILLKITNQMPNEKQS